MTRAPESIVEFMAPISGQGRIQDFEMGHRSTPKARVSRRRSNTQLLYAIVIGWGCPSTEFFFNFLAQDVAFWRYSVKDPFHKAYRPSRFLKTAFK